MAYFPGTTGDDVINGTSGVDFISSSLGNDVVNAGNGDDSVSDDTGEGADTLDGGNGQDQLGIHASGTTGVVFTLDDTAGIHNLYGGEGTYQNFEELFFWGGGYADVVTGGSGADEMYGWGGNDVLSGGGGDDYIGDFFGDGYDTLDGGTGIDTLEIFRNGGTTGIVFTFDTSAGIHNLDGSEGTYENFERLDFYGTSHNDVVTGGSGDDEIGGDGGGYDTFDGGAGTDQLILHSWSASSGITFVLDATAGIHLLPNGGGTYQNFETLEFFGSNSGDNVTGGSGNDILDGGGGNDVLLGDGGDDELAFGIGSGADTLDGGTGTDVLYLFGWMGGTTGVTFALDVSAGLHLLPDGGGAYQNFETLLFEGGEYDDVVAGAAGIDDLEGGGGNDTLTGGGGADTLSGSDGIDTASYANAAAGVTANLANASLNTGDAAGDIYDSIENLTGSTSNDVLVGDGSNNVLTGGGGGDTLDGGTGADQLFGGDGSDLYYVDNAGDLVTETNAIVAVGGTDRVIASITYTLPVNVENLTMVGTGNIIGNGNGSHNFMSGNAQNNTLRAWGGNDVFVPGAGNDWMSGGVGQDYFVFNTALGGNNRDAITDFVHVDDTIRLENAIFTGLGLTTGTLSAAAFYAGTAAHDADDRIIYNAANGQILYDADGLGGTAAVLFATLTSKPANIDHTDFVII